jgi:tetratricopeptide (TPR) repeat protein
MNQKKKLPQLDPIPVPAELPPFEGVPEHDVETRSHRRRTSRWTLLLAVGAVLLFLFILVLAGLGIYSGLKDRAIAGRQTAQEHFALGEQYLSEGDYELAVAEFELAMRNDPGLADPEGKLARAKELAQAQITPTSEARRDAAITLYRRAVTHYEAGELDLALTALNELRGLDADYQRANVETMLVTAHYELGLAAVREDRLDDASGHFEAILELHTDSPGEKQAQDQLDLLEVYRAALSHWGQDWEAVIQALKGLYALAPDYKDVRVRLHDAYALSARQHAGQAEWCLAAEEYAAAVAVFSLEETVDRRAAFQCQAATVSPTSTPTPSRAAAQPSPTPQQTPKPKPSASLKGRLVFPSYDAIRQKHDLLALDLPSGRPRVLLENASQPAYEPGGTRLAFRNLHPSYLGLGILDLSTAQVQELTAHVEDSTPTWSADANQIVFGSDKEGDRKWRIFVISPGEVRGEGQMWTFGLMPAWSPDGLEIAYRGCDVRGDNCGLWTMEPGGSSQVRLTTDPSDTSPSWKPDSSEVAFVSARAGNWELYTVDVATGVVSRLTNHPAADVAPVWSPDGKRLAFLSNRDGVWALHVLDVKTGQVQKIIATGDAYPDAVSERLAWLP